MSKATLAGACKHCLPESQQIVKPPSPRLNYLSTKTLTDAPAWPHFTAWNRNSTIWSDTVPEFLLKQRPKHKTFPRWVANKLHQTPIYDWYKPYFTNDCIKKNHSQYHVGFKFRRWRDVTKHHQVLFCPCPNSSNFYRMGHKTWNLEAGKKSATLPSPTSS